MMNTEELRRFVKKKLISGYPDGELRNELLEKGYSSEQIQLAFYNPPPIKEGQPSKTKISRNFTPVWYVLSIGLVIAGIAIINVFRESPIGYAFIIFGGLGTLTRYFLTIISKK